MSPLGVLGLTLALSALGAVLVWRVSLRLQDAGIVDVLWGYGFAVLVAVAYAMSASAGPRSHVLLVCVLLWSGRLGTHLLVRGVGRGEDFRYRSMRAHHGEDFARRSLTRVFLLQATVQWLLSLPLQVALLFPGSDRLGFLDALGLGLFATGLVLETVADYQLAGFRGDPACRGRVLDSGLWRYSRHPNYFGEFMIAWGLFLLVANTPHGLWFAWSPALLTFLLLRVSGIPILEAGLRERLPGYADYVRRTPAFIPRGPGWPWKGVPFRHRR